MTSTKFYIRVFMANFATSGVNYWEENVEWTCLSGSQKSTKLEPTKISCQKV